MEMTKSELLPPVKEENSLEYADSPLLKGVKDSETHSTTGSASGTKATQPVVRPRS